MFKKPFHNSIIFKFVDWLAALLAWLAFFVFRKLYVDG